MKERKIMSMILGIIAIFFLMAITKLVKYTNDEYNYCHLYYKEVYVFLRKRKNIRFFEKKEFALNKKECIEVWSSMELALEMQKRAKQLLAQYEELKVIKLFIEPEELKKIEKEISQWIQCVNLEN